MASSRIPGPGLRKEMKQRRMQKDQALPATLLYNQGANSCCELSSPLDGSVGKFQSHGAVPITDVVPAWAVGAG